MLGKNNAKKKIQKVIVLGSGALKIGEAGEFDYSGSQAIKAMREEKIKTVLINPNIATNQTSKNLADKVYFLPVNTYFVEQIIKKEKPNGILLSFGGQTALNCGTTLFKDGILNKYGTKVLGTPIEGIERTEDRQLFKEAMQKSNVPVLPSSPSYSVEEAIKVAKNIPYL